VGVVGGGNSALQEALLLSETSKKVYVIQNLDFLTGEDKLQKAIEGKDNIEVILGTVVDGLLGEKGFGGVSLSGKDGKSQKIYVSSYNEGLYYSDNGGETFEKLEAIWDEYDVYAKNGKN
jgi:thioredoxin reductase (NADPH)